MKIIGFSGLAGSGKDTAANILIEKYGNEYFRKISFGDAVKDIASVAFGWDRKLLQGDTVESRTFREKNDEFWTDAFKKPFTPRLALQYIGTDLFRNVIDPNFWVFVVQKRIKESDFKGTYLITDVRFPNEIKMIKEMGGITCNIVRGKLPDWYPLAIAYNQNKIELPEELQKIHLSERALCGLNLEEKIIYNTGSLDDFRKLVFDMFKPSLEK